jgi:hypothetical protein
VPLSFDPGEAYQFDWSHEIAIIDGITTTIKVAHVRLCHSRMPFIQAYPRETQEMVFDAHDKAFAFFGGACARGIYDNMKTAVDTIFVGKDRAYNRRFQQMCGHYLVDPVAYAGIGLGERASGEPGGRAPPALLRSAAEVQELCRTQCLAPGPLHRLGQGPSASGDPGQDDLGGVRERSAPSLVPYAGPFDGFHAVPASVSKTCLVRFDKNRYSVEARAVGRPVEIRAYADRWNAGRTEALSANMCVHSGGQYDLRSAALHPCFGTQARRLAQWCPVQGMGVASGLAAVQRKLERQTGGDRQMVEILGAVLSTAWRPWTRPVPRRCRTVHSAGVVLNILARRREPEAL